MRLVCDSIARPNDPESFFDCALFHLQRLPKITPETLLLVRNLLERLHQWANSSQDLYDSAQTLSIVALWKHFQPRDRFSNSNNITSIEEGEQGGELLKDEPEQNWLIPNVDDFGHN
ncbi:unnamed protein product [Rhizoctonia solani]|nr:unnamed protein product [Rhizoctonia solani]